MNKPEKKEGHITKGIGYNPISDKDVGYNQCWDDREKWLKEFLPSEDELYQIICANMCLKKAAIAISKRIRGE